VSTWKRGKNSCSNGLGLGEKGEYRVSHTQTGGKEGERFGGANSQAAQQRKGRGLREEGAKRRLRIPSGGLTAKEKPVRLQGFLYFGQEREMWARKM